MNYIVLKWNSLKGYNFSDEFYNKYKNECDEFIKLYNEYFENSCSCFGANEQNKNNKDLKIKICESVCKLFNLGVQVENNWDDSIFSYENDIRKYLMLGVRK